MEATVTLGGDLPVCRLGFGAMRITGPGVWGDPRDPTASRAVLRRATELGVNFIDTADSYGPGVSERLIAEALHPYPPELVIATKGGYARPGPGRWHPDGRPEHLREACEGSLRRLKLEHIDLYQLHKVDPRIPFVDSVGALAELRRQGKVRHVGLSNVSTKQIEEAKEIVPIVSVQNRYNVVDRVAEDVLRYCERKDIAFICWFPLANGVLGRSSRALRRVTDPHQARPARIALAWLLHHSPATIAIPGTSSFDHLTENMRALDVRLSAEELMTLDEYRLSSIESLRRAARGGARRARRLIRRVSP
jgi:aryl-alcohol dehydrogenase-like predicted oxidoreductase